MKKIYIEYKRYFNLDVVRVKFSSLLANSIDVCFEKYIRADHLKYLLDTYRITIADVKAAIKKCIKVTSAGPYIIIYVDQNVSIKSKNNQKIAIETLLRFLDYGNLANIKGNMLFTNIMSLVETNFVKYCLLV